jgi:hypothetical protein
VQQRASQHLIFARAFDVVAHFPLSGEMRSPIINIPRNT